MRNLQTHLIPAKTGIRLKKMHTYQPKRGKMVISIGRVLTLSNRNSVSIVCYFIQIQSKMHIILVYLMHHLDFAQMF